MIRLQQSWTLEANKSHIPFYQGKFCLQVLPHEGPVKKRKLV
jgi:hypothetical protein